MRTGLRMQARFFVLLDGFGYGSRKQPLTPALSRGRGSRFLLFSKLEFGSILHVGVTRQNNAVSPLSLRERVRVRAIFELPLFV